MNLGRRLVRVLVSMGGEILLPVVAVNSNAATPMVQHQDMEIVDFEGEVNGDLIQKETLGMMQGLIQEMEVRNSCKDFESRLLEIDCDLKKFDNKGEKSRGDSIPDKVDNPIPYLHKLIEIPLSGIAQSPSCVLDSCNASEHVTTFIHLDVLNYNCGEGKKKIVKCQERSGRKFQGISQLWMRRGLRSLFPNGCL